MESVIRLCYCSPHPLHRLSNGSKGFPNASSSRFHRTLFNHASLCASQFPTLHPLATRSFPLANCNIPGRLFSAPSINNGDSDSNKVLRGGTGVSVVLACVIGLLFNFNGKMNPMFNTAYAASSLLPGGEAAVESLLETIAAPPNQSGPKYEGEPNKNDVEALKLHAAGKSKSGDRRLAVRILENEYKKCKKNGWQEAEFNLEMALIELLIIQGKFEEARKLVDARINDFVPDKVKDAESKIEKLFDIQLENKFLTAKVAQLILYKAIVQSMSKHKKKEAPKWWEAFAKVHSAIKSESSMESSPINLEPPN